jgi:cell division GTPase FtsZ
METLREQEGSHGDERVPVESGLLVGIGEAGCRAVLEIGRECELGGFRKMLADTFRGLGKRMVQRGDRLILDGDWQGEFQALLADRELVVLVSGLGTEQDSSALRTMSKLVLEKGLSCLIFVLTPFSEFEDDRIIHQASSTIDQLKEQSNAVIVIPSSLLFSSFPENVTVMEAYVQATSWLAEAVSSLLRPLVSENVSNVSLDRLDWLLKQKHSICSIGLGWGDGPDAADVALDELMSCPLLRRMPGAPSVDAGLVILSVSTETTFRQAQQILKQVKGAFDDPMVISFSICQDETLAEGVRITALLRTPDAPEHDKKPAQEANEATASKTAKKRSKKGKHAQQMDLPFAKLSLGIFSSKEPTRYGGENLDIPTYQRFNTPIDLETK